MEFHFPQRVFLGPGVGQKLGASAKDLGARMLLLVDGSLEGGKELASLTQSLDRAKVSSMVLARQARQTLAEAMQEAVTMAKASRVDLLGAFGGSDQLSLGRAALNEMGTVKPIPYMEIPSGMCLPLLLRPEAFLSTGHPSDLRYLPFAAPAGHHIFLDPHLTSGLTTKASVAALLESLFYAVEAYLHDSSTLMDRSLLSGAIEVVWSTLKQIHENPVNLEYRWPTLQAGLNIAMGCALGPRGTGVAFSFALAGLAGLPSSAFGSLLLAPLLEFEAGKAGQKLFPLAKAFGYSADGDSLAAIGPKIAQDVRKYLGVQKLPVRLADYKLVDSQITQAVDAVQGLGAERGGILDPDQLPDFVRTIL